MHWIGSLHDMKKDVNHVLNVLTRVIAQISIIIIHRLLLYLVSIQKLEDRTFMDYICSVILQGVL